VCDKFRRNAVLVVPDAAVRRLEEGILALEESAGVRDLATPSR
jgi:hypothetical protein